MTKEAAQAVTRELESLTEEDQRRVLDFLASLKHRRRPETRVSTAASNPALAIKDGLLVFTGRIDEPEIDWLQVVREERDHEVIQALGRTPNG